MSYKTDLQANNAELQSNNTELQSILDMILALGLVDAPEMATITVSVVGTIYPNYAGVIIDNVMHRSPTSVEVPVGTIVRLCILSENGAGSITVTNSNGTSQKVALTTVSKTTDVISYNCYYDYAVIGNTTINLTNDGEDYEPGVGIYHYGTIKVTEG